MISAAQAMAPRETKRVNMPTLSVSAPLTLTGATVALAVDEAAEVERVVVFDAFDGTGTTNAVVAV